eukprot:9653554-Lingulodinium_polyedra.AAC.1
MYNYLRRATKRKPLYELDALPYHSPSHPEGDALKALLEAGDTYQEVRASKWRAVADAGSSQLQLRSPFGIFFQRSLEMPAAVRKVQSPSSVMQ